MRKLHYIHVEDYKDYPKINLLSIGIKLTISKIILIYFLMYCKGV